MTISVFIAVTGCPANKRAEVIAKDTRNGTERVVAILGPQTNASDIVYDGQYLFVREVDADPPT